MQRGGRRPGAGRPKGALNKRTKARLDVAAQALAAGKTPLEVMLEAMREAYETSGAIAAVPFAKEAAPYVHPRLSAVDANAQGDLIVELVTFDSAPDKQAAAADSDAA